MELDFAFGEEADEFEKFLGGDGARAFFFDLDFARRADAELEVGGSDGEAGAFGFDQKIGKNGDGGLAFDYALRGGQFIE